MAYVTVPKDLDRIKNKVVLNLTLRQLVCFGIAGTFGIPAYFGSKGLIGSSNAALVMVAVMLPGFLFALYEKDGLPLEKIIENYIRVRWLRPGRRVKEKSRKKIADRSKNHCKGTEDNGSSHKKGGEPVADIYETMGKAGNLSAGFGSIPGDGKGRHLPDPK